MTYTLRPYQQHSVEMLRHAFGHKKKKRPVLQAPAGAGKTIVAVDIIHSALDKGKRILFVVDRISLIDQTYRAFQKHGIDCGVIQGDHPARNDYLKVQLASVQTLTRRKMKPETDLIVVDEAHCMYKGFINEITVGVYQHTPVIGLSATPWTKGMGLVYDELIVVSTSQELIDGGYLSDFDIYAPCEPDMKGVKTVAGDWNQLQMGERINKPKITGSIVDNWLKRGEGRQTVAFCTNIAHSQAVAEQFIDVGVTAECIDAYTDFDEREQILARHESGETKILCNCEVFSKGWDSPNTTCLILGRGTKSLMLYIQIVNRVLRKPDNGDTRKALIFDHSGTVKRLGFPTSQLPEMMDCTPPDERQDPPKPKDKLPSVCPQCAAVVESFPCHCGCMPKKGEIEVEDGELKKLKKSDASPSEKQAFYSGCLGYVRSKGWSDGAASHIYKDKFGVWPAKKTGIPALAPSKEVLGFITHRNIKRAKGSKFNRRRA